MKGQDKVLPILLKHSIKSDWVEQEVGTVFEGGIDTAFLLNSVETTELESAYSTLHSR